MGAIIGFIIGLFLGWIMGVIVSSLAITSSRNRNDDGDLQCPLLGGEGDDGDEGDEDGG